MPETHPHTGQTAGPPMGWNSWYAQGPAVTEQAVRAAAEALVRFGLARAGFDLVVIDDGWQGERGGAFGAIQPNERFGDLGRLAADLHRMGLRLGLYSTPWIASYAGFVGGSAPEPGGGYEGLALPRDERLLPTQLFGPHPGSERLGLRRVGHWMLERDLRQWAAWGVDFVKLDWHPIDPATAGRIRRDLDKAERPMLLSLSNAARIEDAPAISTLADCWRTTGDIVDDWDSVAGIARYQLAWNPWRGPGRWPDPDLLQLGWLLDPTQPGAPLRPSRLTPAEQRFQLGAWCLLGAPLFLSCDLDRLGPDLLRLLLDPVALAVGRDPLGASPVPVWESHGVEVWARPLSGGRRALGVLNFADRRRQVRLDWPALLGGVPGRLWRAWHPSPDAGPSVVPRALDLPPHGIELFLAEVPPGPG